MSNMFTVARALLVSLLTIILPHSPADPLEQKLLTKGDNNSQDDLAIYEDIDWLERKYVIGKVWGYVNVAAAPFCLDFLYRVLVERARYIPYIGYASIALVRQTFNSTSG